MAKGGFRVKSYEHDFGTETISEGTRVSRLRDKHDFDEDGKDDDSEKGEKDEREEKGEKEEHQEKDNDDIDNM